jgi:DNA-binding GntR family transcriptional regulator
MSAESESAKTNISDLAYETIRQRLRRAEIGPGDRLIDKALAAELNMSRMPAREALIRLVHEGYLVGSTKGFRLPELSRTDILEIFEIRLALEPEQRHRLPCGDGRHHQQS